MARNVEIKARIASIDALLPRACALADGEPELIVQDDTFFHVPMGRLKLREFADGSAELIHYRRSDTHEAKLSDYQRVAVEPAAMRALLDCALGTAGRVAKQRWLLRVGHTRIHLDRVAGLGDFMELEVVLRNDQSEADGAAIAEGLMRSLCLAHAQRIAVAYVDLLAAPR